MQIPIAPWLALTFLLHGARTLPVLPGMTSVAVTLYATLAVAERGILPIPGPAYFGVIAALTLTATLPFVADRLAGVRLSGWAATLIFPMAWVAFEFLQSRFTPNATWGSLAYTQYGNLPLMQLAAVTGIWGITFLIAWFASVINAADAPVRARLRSHSRVCPAGRRGTNRSSAVRPKHPPGRRSELSERSFPAGGSDAHPGGPGRGLRGWRQAGMSPRVVPRQEPPRGARPGPNW
jgi:hypothetical protein